jgi:NADH:ubiquinone oxidoreductase subunit K
VGSQLFVLTSQPSPPGVVHGTDTWIANWWYPYFLAALGLITAAPFFLLFKENQKKDSTDNGISDGILQDTEESTEEKEGTAFHLDRYLTESAALLRRLFGNPVFSLYVVDMMLLDLGFSGMRLNTLVLLEEVYRSPVSPQVVGLIILSVTVVMAAIGGALVTRLQPSPRILAILNIILLGKELLPDMPANLLYCTQVSIFMA